MPAILELEAIHAGYFPGIDVLAGVDLAVGHGTITAVIGPNGAGKSTLLKTVFGFVRAGRGRIVFRGRQIQTLAPYVIKRLGLSYVPQTANVFPQLTVEENLLLGAWIMRRNRPQVTGMLEQAYAMFPRFRGQRRRRATTLSGGEAKMLSLVKEVMTDPTLLLVDEPSAGLAPRAAAQIYAWLIDARRRGMTVLLVDQNIRKAVEISDYVYLIEGGQVRRQGSRESFLDHLRDIVRSSLLGV